MSAGPVLSRTWLQTLNRFRPGQQREPPQRPPICSGFQTERRKRNGEATVFHAFQTVAYRRDEGRALIVAYQLLDQIRIRLRYARLDIGDVVMAATTALFALALFCALWAWGEWCWFKLRRFLWRRTATSPLKRSTV
jgi:hypothetical protein